MSIQTDKTALVFVHGYFGGSPQWEAQVAAFSGDFDVITPDLPGFGLNSASQPLCIDTNTIQYTYPFVVVGIV